MVAYVNTSILLWSIEQDVKAKVCVCVCVQAKGSHTDFPLSKHGDCLPS